MSVNVKNLTKVDEHIAGTSWLLQLIIMQL
jgi:hypothetical protein